MKINKLYITILALLFTSTGFAQLSEGGTPPSFKNNMKSSFETVYLEAVSTNWISENTEAASKNGNVQPSGKLIETNINLKNSGTWETRKNGDKIWRLKVIADKAQGINTYFKDFFLPEGAKLFIYNAEKTQILGAFTAQNNNETKVFATEIIFGSNIILEYYEPKDQLGKGNFTLDRVGSFFRDLEQNQAKFFESSKFCQVNVNCAEGANFQDEKKGVARIIIPVSSSTVGFCSGSLVNNTALDCKPYFLTAFHCGDDATAAQFNTWVFYFNYEFNTCASTSTEPSNSNSLTGAAVRARSNNLTQSSSSSDFLLLELNNTIPANYNVYFNGWDATNTVPSSGVSIHHPSGDVKKISTFNSSPDTRGISWNGDGTYSVQFNGNTHWSLNWVATANGHGVTEGGSSGSPLFNAQGLIIGDLSGGSSQCTNVNANDQYGKMSYSWESNAAASNRQLKPWLDPTNSGALTLTGTYAPCTVAPPTVDAGLDGFESPDSTSCNFDIAPIVILKNYGNITLTSATISYQLNSGTNTNFNWTGSLAPNETQLVNLTAVTTTQQSNIISASVSNPNGLTDANTANNNISLNFVAGISAPLPFKEFADNLGSKFGFVLNNSDNEVTWAYPGFGSFGTSPNSLFVDNWDYDAVGQFDWLVTESYDFSNAVSEKMYFDIAYTYYQLQNGNNVSYDSLGIAVSLDCGENFFWLWKEGGIELATVEGGLGEEFVPEDNQWQNKEIDLSQLDGEPNVSFALIAINGYGNNLYIDNIGIGEKLISSVKDINWGSDMVIYPNPTTNVLNLKSPTNEKLSYKIINSLGQTFNTGNLNSYENAIEVSNLNKGIYFIEIRSENGNKLMKFIKE